MYVVVVVICSVCGSTQNNGDNTVTSSCKGNEVNLSQIKINGVHKINLLS